MSADQPTSRVRRIFPPSGCQYELFDSAIFVTAIVAVGYVIENPQPAQATTLNFADQVLSLNLWGAVLTACAVVAVVCSYVPRWLSFGYGLLAAACFFWAAVFTVGVFFYEGQSRSLLSALIYLWVFRRLVTVKNGGGC